MNKQRSRKSATKKNPGAEAPGQATSPQRHCEPETVVRHNLLGICEFMLFDPGERLPKEARDALFEAAKASAMQCVAQCPGYVFNLHSSIWVTLVDQHGNVASSQPFSGPSQDKPTAR